MEKAIRNRKAFYEKENDNKNCNKRKDLLASFNWKSNHPEKLYHSVQQSLTSKIEVLKVKKPKDNSAAYCQQYAEELISKCYYGDKRHRFLAGHDIDSGLRARMLDWMV